MARIVALSTFDNPYNPITDFKNWFSFDIDKGHDCCGLLDRFSLTSDALTPAENSIEIESAIDEIIKYDVENVYKKVVVET